MFSLMTTYKALALTTFAYAVSKTLAKTAIVPNTHSTVIPFNPVRRVDRRIAHPGLLRPHLAIKLFLHGPNPA